MKLGPALRLAPEVGLDLGTSRARVLVAGSGIVRDEPSVLALDGKGRIVAFGDAAMEAIAAQPDLKLAQPIRGGVIADLSLATKWIELLLRSVYGPKKLLRPQVAICVPTDATSVERRASSQAVERAGAGQAVVLGAAMAAGLGAGLPLRQPRGALVVHLGASTTDVALISLGSVVACRTSRTGGYAFDEAIEAHIRSAHGLQVGRAGAEQIKIKLGSAVLQNPELRLLVKGRDMINGAPRAVEIGSEEIRLAVSDHLKRTVEAVWSVLEQTPAELGADVLESGIVMTGGASQFHGLDQMISDATELPVRVADNPADCAAIGLGVHIDRLSAHPVQAR